LSRDFPEDWLLRWNLLEATLKLNTTQPLVSSLVRELEALEIRFKHQEPIASGLSYLGVLAG
jgi:hypothetical protein